MTYSRLDPPAWYRQANDDGARLRIWAETIDRLTDAGTVFTADPRLIDAYVCAAANHEQAAQLIARSSILITRTSGPPVENPALPVQRRAAADLARAARPLGLHRATAHVPAARPDPIGGARWCQAHDRAECTHHRLRGCECGDKTRPPGPGGCCHQRAVKGTPSCYMHAGKTLARAKAEGAAAIAAMYTSPADVTPAEALLDAVQWAAGNARDLRVRVAELAAEPGPDGEPGSGLWWGPAEEVWRDGELVERKFRAGPHVILRQHDAAQDRLIRAAAAANTAGAQDQAVNVAAALGAGARRLFDAIFAALDLTEDQWARVPVVVPALLAEYDTEAAEGAGG